MQINQQGRVATGVNLLYFNSKTSMRAIHTLLFSVAFGLAPMVAVYGQNIDHDHDAEEHHLPKLEKSIRKEWKARLREMEPEDLKALYDKQDALNADLIKKGQEVGAVKAQLAETQEETAQLKAKLEVALSSPPPAPSAPASSEALAANAYDARNAEVAKGVQFKVQIGAYRNRDLTKYFANNKNFSGEVESDGTKKYTLGQFVNYWEADNFKKYLREMGVKDAWTVAYRDGARVPLRDVLEGATAAQAGTQ